MADRHITFLLGAGASAQSLPVQSQLPDRIRWLRDSLLVQFPPGRYLSKRPFFLEQLDRLIDILEQYGSFDHYAKKSKDADSLKKYKFIYSTAWLLLQILAGQADSRYSKFIKRICLSAALGGLPVIRPNVCILSWNYDIQIERMYTELNGLKSDAIDLAAENLRIKPWARVDNSVINKVEYVGQFFKLNGTAGQWIDRSHLINPDPRHSEKAITNDHFHFFDDSSRSEVAKFLYDDFEGYLGVRLHGSERPRTSSESSLTFAWEESQTAVRKEAVTAIADTEVLVVIGYSLFKDNHEIDKSWLKQMKNINEIHIQCGSQNDQVKKRLKRLLSCNQKRTVSFHLHPELDEFILPPYL